MTRCWSAMIFKLNALESSFKYNTMHERSTAARYHWSVGIILSKNGRILSKHLGDSSIHGAKLISACHSTGWLAVFQVWLTAKPKTSFDSQALVNRGAPLSLSLFLSSPLSLSPRQYFSTVNARRKTITSTPGDGCPRCSKYPPQFSRQ